MKKFIENKLAENFANKLKDLQKEGLLESVKSFDLDFTGKGINIRLNESTYDNYHLKPVSFTFNNDTFTLKNTDIENTYDGQHLLYEIEVTNNSGLLYVFHLNSSDINSSHKSELLNGNIVPRNWYDECAEWVCNQAYIRQNKEAFIKAFGEAFTKLIQPMLSHDGKNPTRHDNKFLSIKKNRDNKAEDTETIFPCEITTYAEESMARSSLDYYYVGDKDDEDWVWSEYVGEDEGGRMVLENSSELRAALNDLINYCEETGSIDLNVDKAISDLLSTGKAEFIYTSEVNDDEVLKYIIEVQKV